MTGISKAEIDLTFQHTIIEMGGELVSTLLPTKSPEHDNADFAFREWNIICELKVLENDPNQRGALDRKAQALFDKWMGQGRILFYGTRRIDSSTLDRDMQWELAKLHSESVKRALKKANRQIRETKTALGMAGAKGHVVIVNDAVPTLDPYTFAFAVHQSLGQHYSSINGVSLVTVNYVTSLKGLPTKIKFWGNYTREDYCPSLDASYLNQFAETWSKYISDIEGQRVPYLKLPENFDLKQFGPITKP
jgi:hypothetical protein